MTDKEWMDFIRESIASHDRQLGELTDKMVETDRRIKEQTANIDKLAVMSNRDGVDIAALARIAEAHAQRLDRLDGGGDE